MYLTLNIFPIVVKLDIAGNNSSMNLDKLNTPWSFIDSPMLYAIGETSTMASITHSTPQNN